MDFSWGYLLQGFVTALSLQNVLWALLGCFIGTLVGVLPGIGPVSGIAILLPLTTVLPPTSAIIMMAAIYYGAMYGGSTTAIVVDSPARLPPCLRPWTAMRWPSRGGRVRPSPSRPSPRLSRARSV